MQDDKTIEQFVLWEQSRRKPDGRFDLPVRGFGAPPPFASDFEPTFWLPSPVSEKRLRVRDGKPMMENVKSCFDTPEILELRDRIIASIVQMSPGIFTVDVAFTEYAAKLLTFNYSLRDEELEAMLSGSRGWHTSVIQHVCGGDDVVQFIAALRADSRAIKVGPEPDPPELKLWQRLFRKWW